MAIADQEFLVSFGVEIDESGLDKIQEALTTNRELAEQMGSAFESAREAVVNFFAQLSSSLSTDGASNPLKKLQDLSKNGIKIDFDLDTSKAKKNLESFLKEAEKPIKLSADAAEIETAGTTALTNLTALFTSTLLSLKADASAVVSAGQAALNQLKSLYASTTLTLKAQVQTQGTPKTPGGGETPTETPQDTGTPKLPGTPFTRLLEANSGSGAFPKLTELRHTLTVGANAGLPNATTTNNSKNVEAPVTITVQANGNNAEAIGKSIYNMTERYLMRTLQG